MKAKILTILLLSVFTINAQNFTGKATYKTHRKVDIKVSNDKGAPSNDVQKQFHEQIRKMHQKTYTLNFNKSESTYKQEAKLSAPQSQSGVQIQILGSGGGTDILYKNIGEKRYVNKKEISGKRFLIQDKLPDLGWEMTEETKNIGKYTCYKATRSREEEKHNFSISEGGKEDEKKEVIIIKTTAWYTVEIPVSNGPGMHWGLPGLILEIQEGKKTVVCSEIVLNPINAIEIKEPTKGKKVNQEKFDKIMDEKTKEMMERFKNKRKSKDGGSFSIEIQG